MEALSLWEMIWQLGVLCLVATPIIVLLGMVIFAIFWPLNKIDQL